MFVAEFALAERTTTNRRRSPRAPVSLDAQLGEGCLQRTLCRVVDISLHGCRLHAYSSMASNTTIWLNIPGLGAMGADIMWSDDLVAGCQFHAPLTQETFDGFIAGHG
jgi:hypothetical protein